MSIFGAMFSGVSGLSSQSQALGMIADNISNVNTTGYKRTRARFSTLVTQNATSTSYSPGGVQANPLQEIAAQGLLQSSASQTDIAIVGNGFFVVNESATPGISDQYLFTRAGSFTPDRAGFLKNTAGFFLMGWPTDSTGVPTPSNLSVLTSTQALNVSGVSGSATPTTAISIGANLPATAAIGATETITTQVFDSLGVSHNIGYTFTKTAQNSWDISSVPPDGAQTLVLDDATGSPFHSAARMDFDGVPADGENLTITDATNGTLIFEFDTNAAVTAGSIRVNLTGVTDAAGVATALRTAYADYTGSYTGTTVSSVLAPVDLGGWVDPTMAASSTGISASAHTAVTNLANFAGGNLTFDILAGTGEVRLAGVAGLKFGTNGGAAGVAAANSDDLVGLAPGATIEVYAVDGTEDVRIGILTFGAIPTSGGGALDDEGDLTIGPFARTAGDGRMTQGTGNESSALYMQQGTNADAAVTLDLTNITVNLLSTPPSAITQATAASKVYTMVATTSAQANGIVFNSDGTPATFGVAGMDISFSNGAANSTGITIDLGTAGVGDGMTQFASAFTTYFLTQNGVRFGTFSGVTIGADGIVTALFDNGQSTPIYKIPISTFPNPNGLFSKTGNVFAESDTSGVGLINSAGAGSAGNIASGALEASTVDIATEFTNMIITQQAYSASARIITTADEMLDEVLRIAR